MSNDGGSEHEDRELTGGTPDPEDMTSRAEGRPPEEATSEDPAAQAEAILQESEDRIGEAAHGSEPI
jgi:hypothetical protein